MANKHVNNLLTHAVLLALSVLFLAPFAWMVSTSLKHDAHILAQSGEAPRWIPMTERLDAHNRPMVTYKGQTAVDLGESDSGQHVLLMNGEEVHAWAEDFRVQLRLGLRWQNYADVFRRIDFVLYLKNTLFIALSVVFATLISCSLVAYSLARIPWRGRTVLFALVLSTMMVPYQVTLIPLFALFRTLGWTGTFKPLIIPYFFGTPFYIFLLRQFFLNIPQDLSAAARIDGCTELGIYSRIVLPLSKPALAATAVFMFLYQWGDFLNPLIFLQDDRQYTLMLALQQFQSHHESAWGPLMAMSVIITLPSVALFFAAQRAFIQGITMTGLKG